MITPVPITPLASLYLIREAIEPVVAELLTQATGCTVYHELSREVKTGLPWIEVSLEPGLANGQRLYCPGDGATRDVAFNGTLTVVIYSDRGEVPDGDAPAGKVAAALAARMALASQHRTIRAQVLAAMSSSQGKFTAQQLPSHGITFCNIRQQRNGVDSTTSRDVSELTWDTTCNIRPEAMLAAISVLVSGAGTASANGLYTYRGQYNGKPYYRSSGTPDGDPAANFISLLSWEQNDWGLRGSDGDSLYYSLSDTPFPASATWQQDDGDPPVPTFAPLS